MWKVIDLDLNEDIDYIKLNGREYQIGIIPQRLLERVNAIDTTKGLDDLLIQWRDLAKDILEVRNDVINMDHITDEKLGAFIKYILDKVAKKWYVK